LSTLCEGKRHKPEDTALKEKAGRILAAYRERRAKYIGDGKPGAAALVRDWLDDGSGFCAPRTRSIAQRNPPAEPPLCREFLHYGCQ
jgi:hypothetical protein